MVLRESDNPGNKGRYSFDAAVLISPLVSWITSAKTPQFHKHFCQDTYRIMIVKPGHEKCKWRTS